MGIFDNKFNAPRAWNSALRVATEELWLKTSSLKTF